MQLLGELPLERAVSDPERRQGRQGAQDGHGGHVVQGRARLGSEVRGDRPDEPAARRRQLSGGAQQHGRRGRAELGKRRGVLQAQGELCRQGLGGHLPRPEGDEEGAGV